MIHLFMDFFKNIKTKQMILYIMGVSKAKNTY